MPPLAQPTSLYQSENVLKVAPPAVPFWVVFLVCILCLPASAFIFLLPTDPSRGPQTLVLTPHTVARAQPGGGLCWPALTRPGGSLCRLLPETQAHLLKVPWALPVVLTGSQHSTSDLQGVP